MKKIELDSGDNTDQLSPFQLLVRINAQRVTLAGLAGLDDNMEQGAFDRALSDFCRNQAAAGNEQVIDLLDVLNRNMLAYKDRVRGDHIAHVSQGTHLGQLTDPAQRALLNDYVSAYTLRHATEGAIENDLREGGVDLALVLSYRQSLQTEYADMDQVAVQSAQGLVDSGIAMPQVRQMQMQLAVYMNALMPAPLKRRTNELRAGLYNPGLKRVGYDRAIATHPGIDTDRSSINHDTEVLRVLQLSTSHATSSWDEVMRDPATLTTPANIAMQAGVTVELYDYAREHAAPLVSLLDKVPAHTLSGFISMAARRTVVNATALPDTPAVAAQVASLHQNTLEMGQSLVRHLPSQNDRDILGRFIYGYLVKELELDDTGDDAHIKLLAETLRDGMSLGAGASLGNRVGDKPRPQ